MLKEKEVERNKGKREGEKVRGVGIIMGKCVFLVLRYTYDLNTVETGC